MEDFENKTAESKPSKAKDILLAVIVTEAVCVALILLGVLLMKYFSSGGFSRLQGFYSEHFLTETSLSEVIKE